MRIVIFAHLYNLEPFYFFNEKIHCINQGFNCEKTPWPRQLLLRKTLLWITYSFRGLLHYHNHGKYGGILAGMLLEKKLRVLHLNLQVTVLSAIMWWIGAIRGCKKLVREGSETGHDGQENIAAWLTSNQSVSLFIQNLMSQDTFMLFQNTDPKIFGFVHVFHFLLLIF